MGVSLTTIAVGTTVEWVWQSDFHSTTSGTCSASNCIPGPVGTTLQLWDSGQHNNGLTFTRTFNTVDTLTYFCTVHGVLMQGLINVLPAPPPQPARPAARR